MKAIGIDLGTTNAVVSMYDKGVARTIDIYGRKTTPSVVGWNPEKGELVVGHAAKSRVLIDPEFSVVSNKRFMGERDKTYDILGKQYTPVDIACFILKHLVDGASQTLGEKISRAVVTVPAYFNQNQKEDTKNAAEKAGLEVLMLQAEPTAAAIAYGFNQEKDQTILVYDLGGGTFDVSILAVEGNNFAVKAIGGNAHLGGENFDEAILNHVYEIILSDFGLDLAHDESFEARKTRQELITLVEQAKIDLAETKKTEMYVPALMGRGPFEYELTRSELKRLLAPFISQTTRIVRETLEKVNISADEINRVVCVGGSTKSPLIVEAITEEIKAPYRAENVDEIVATGAALTAVSYSLPIDINIQNVTPFNLGIRIKKNKVNDYFERLIPEQTSIPASVTKEFKTVRSNQIAVEVAVFQGSSNRCGENIFIGGFILEGIPPDAAGKMKVPVTFTMDDSDILNVSASCQDQQKEFAINVNRVNDLVAIRSNEANADIVFLIDTSGSMSRELDGIKSLCVQFAEQVADQNIDCRLGLIDFDWDGRGDHKFEVFPIVADVHEFKQNISFLKIGRLGGGGCYVADRGTFPVFKAVPSVYDNNLRAKILILVSDEVGSNRVSKKIIKTMLDHQITIHVVGVPGHNAHKKIANGTNGKFWNIFEARNLGFSVLLENIAREIALTI